MDSGPELISRELDLWACLNGVTLDFRRPGKPTDNVFIESFNGSFRAECLHASWFMSLEDARSKRDAWRADYNEVRPHGSFGHRAPIELDNAQGQHAGPEAERSRILSGPVVPDRGQVTGPLSGRRFDGAREHLETDQ